MYSRIKYALNRKELEGGKIMRVPTTENEFITTVNYIKNNLEDTKLPLHPNKTIIQAFVCRILTLYNSEGVERIPNRILGVMLYCYIKNSAEISKVSIKEEMENLFDSYDSGLNWNELFSLALGKRWTIVGEQKGKKYYLGLVEGRGRLSYAVLIEPKIFDTKRKAQEEANKIIKNINGLMKDGRARKEYWRKTKVYVKEV